MAEQRDMAWVKSSTPEQVDNAYKAGELEYVLGSRDEVERLKPPQTDAEYAASLGITEEEFGHINRPDVLAKIVAHSEATGAR
jgi:hypothetical protein